MISEFFVVGTIKRAGYYTDNCLYFTGKRNKHGWKVALEWLCYWVNLCSKDTFGIIVAFNGNIAFFPLKLNKTLDPSIDQKNSILIRKDEIESIKVSPAFLAKRITVKRVSGKSVSFTVEKKNEIIKSHERNLNEFIEKYTN